MIWPLTPEKQLLQRALLLGNATEKVALYFTLAFLQLEPMSQALIEFITWREMGWEARLWDGFTTLVE